MIEKQDISKVDSEVHSLLYFNMLVRIGLVALESSTFIFENDLSYVCQVQVGV